VRSKERGSTAVPDLQRGHQPRRPDPTKGSIVGTVQTASVNTRDHDRDAALLEKDWFDTKGFPDARFESQKIERAADGSTRRAASSRSRAPRSRPSSSSRSARPRARARKARQFSGTMAINRFDYNVGEGWNDTSWVSQDVSVEIKLDLKRSARGSKRKGRVT